MNPAAESEGANAASVQSAVTDQAARPRDIAAQYRAITTGAALWHRADRGLLAVAGKDRAAWLHNLCTQNIKVLSPGDGIYTFALNVKGRILFDLNVWVDTDQLWLDVDRRFVAGAFAHLNKYIIAEDVRVMDRSDDFVRFALLGPVSGEILARLNLGNAPAMAQLQHTSLDIAGAAVRVVRHDLCGVPGWELSAEAGSSDAVQKTLLQAGQGEQLRPIGTEAVNVRRIEAGIPWPVSEINDTVLPAETRQLERAVNFNKGCYLGQEIVERMRSRGGLARSLVGMRIDGLISDETLQQRPTLLRDGRATGELTSACLSPSLKTWIGLGYAKSADAQVGTALSVETPHGEVPTRVAELPFLSHG